MRLTILGSGSFIPTPKRNCSGYLLDIGRETVLLDGGSGTIRQVACARRNLLEIRRVFYSHFHLDHLADFLPLLFTRKYYKPQRPTAPITIHAHPEFKSYYDDLTQLFAKWVTETEFPPEFSPVLPGEYAFPEYKVKVFASNHTPESLMYRFEEQGLSLIYTGDVDLCAELLEATRDVDLLVIECGNSDENANPGHMNPAKIKELIHQARPRQVLITHIPPEVETLNIEKYYGSDLAPRITITEDLQVFTVTKQGVRH